jgi:hypothetical protein
MTVFVNAIAQEAAIGAKYVMIRTLPNRRRRRTPATKPPACRATPPAAGRGPAAHHLEIDQRFDADIGGPADVSDPGDASDNRRENDRSDDHLDRPDERVVYRFSEMARPG